MPPVWEVGQCISPHLYLESQLMRLPSPGKGRNRSWQPSSLEIPSAVPAERHFKRRRGCRMCIAQGLCGCAVVRFASVRGRRRLSSLSHGRSVGMFRRVCMNVLCSLAFLLKFYCLCVSTGWCVSWCDVLCSLAYILELTCILPISVVLERGQVRVGARARVWEWVGVGWGGVVVMGGFVCPHLPSFAVACCRGVYAHVRARARVCVFFSCVCVVCVCTIACACASFLSVHVCIHACLCT